MHRERYAFARLTGVTAPQVNNWAQGRAVKPKWAALIAAMLVDFTPEALEITVEAAIFDWIEVLGVSLSSNASMIRQAMLRLAVLYNPNNGGQSEQMTRINAVYEEALGTMLTEEQRNR